MDFYLIPLKLKYRVRKQNSGGPYKQRTNSAKPGKGTEGNGPRRRIGLGAVGLPVIAKEKKE